MTIPGHLGGKILCEMKSMWNGHSLGIIESECRW